MAPMFQRSSVSSFRRRKRRRRRRRKEKKKEKEKTKDPMRRRIPLREGSCGCARESRATMPRSPRRGAAAPRGRLGRGPCQWIRSRQGRLALGGVNGRSRGRPRKGCVRRPPRRRSGGGR